MTTKSLSEAKAQLTRILTEVEELGESVTITRSGRPVGVLLPVDEYEGLLETLEILGDASLLGAVREGMSDAEAGRVVTHDELWRELDP